ncbi:hypothetical protein Tco_1382557, partial [Tanacetum coccineum]
VVFRCAVEIQDLLILGCLAFLIFKLLMRVHSNTPRTFLLGNFFGVLELVEGLGQEVD